jgi:hypothetical protein
MALDVIGSDLPTAKSRFTTQKQVTTTQLSGYRTRSRDLPAYPRESIRLYTTDHWSFLQWCHPLKMLQNLRILHLHTTGYRDWPPCDRLRRRGVISLCRRRIHLPFILYVSVEVQLVQLEDNTHPYEKAQLILQGQKILK